MKNWKTSLAGIAGGIAIAAPDLIAFAQAHATNYQGITVGMVVALIGVLAKDFDKTNAATPVSAQPVGANPPVTLGSSVLTKLPLVIALLIPTLLLSACAEMRKIDASAGHGFHYVVTHPLQDLEVAADVAADIQDPANIIGQVAKLASTNPDTAALIGPAADAAAIYKSGEIVPREKLADDLEQSIFDVTDDDSADGAAAAVKAEVLRSLPPVVTGAQANRVLGAVSRHAATGLQQAAADSVP